MKKPKNDSSGKLFPTMRLKITNTRAGYYPNPLIETDYHKVKVGDIVHLGYNQTTLYQVQEISREILEEAMEKRLLSRITYQQFDKTNQCNITIVKDQRAYDLIQEYKKNANFGVCRIKLKTLIRGTKAPKRGGTKLMFELEGIRYIDYRNDIRVVKIQDLVNFQQTMSNRVDYQITRLNDRKNNILARKQALINLDNALNPKLPEPVPTGIDEVEEKEVVEAKISTEQQEVLEQVFGY